ncbi:hypothetical protein INR49_022278 [Caranx melampygus]|nr:hypothetical protein INR49_022278 [Caranx melampygus]
MVPILMLHMEPHQPHSFASKHCQIIDTGLRGAALSWDSGLISGSDSMDPVMMEEPQRNSSCRNSSAVTGATRAAVSICGPQTLYDTFTRLTMPGKCKFQDSWLSKDIYKDWLLKDVNDIHFARCRACCKTIKLQTMGEAALTSHAGGAGHKAAVTKLLEAGNLMMISAAEPVNGSVTETEDNKEQVAICMQRDALDRISGSNWSDLHHSPTSNSTSQNAEIQDVALPSSYITAAGTSRLISQRLHPPGSGAEETGRRSVQHESVELSTVELQRSQVLEQQQQQMKILEWENRMKVLAWEQELVREKSRAARQKEKAFRMKKAYYKAKLKRMGENVPPSSSSSSDEEEKAADATG